MEEQYHIRLGSITDVDELFDLYMHPSTNRFLNFELMTKNDFKPFLNDFLCHGNLCVYVQNSQIVAACMLMNHKYRASHVVTLTTLAVHHQWQHQGIGTRFLNNLCIAMKESGITRLDLCVESDNIVGQQFYKKLGFEQEGVLKNYYRRATEAHYVNEYIMALFL